MVMGEGTAVSLICQERLFTKQASGTTNASLKVPRSQVKKKTHWEFGRDVCCQKKKGGGGQ